MGIETDFQNLTPTKKVETAKLTNSSVSTQVQPVTAADIYKFAFININKNGNGQYSSNNEKIKTALNNDKDLQKYGCRKADGVYSVGFGVIGS